MISSFVRIANIKAIHHQFTRQCLALVCVATKTVHVSSVQFFVKIHLKKSTESAVSMNRCVCVYFVEIRTSDWCNNINALKQLLFSLVCCTHALHWHCSVVFQGIHTHYIFELAFCLLWLFLQSTFHIDFLYLTLSLSLSFSVCVLYLWWQKC